MPTPMVAMDDPDCPSMVSWALLVVECGGIGRNRWFQSAANPVTTAFKRAAVALSVSILSGATDQTSLFVMERISTVASSPACLRKAL